jgi:signal transduction histidine kinase
VESLAYLFLPPFLFVVMGVVIIFAIVATHRVAQLYADPDIAALIVLALAAFLMVVGYMIIGSFEKLAVSRKKERDQAKELLELKDQFVFLAAHELRAPATAIKWALELIQSDKPEILKEDPESFDAIIKNSERLVNLVHDLLETSRIESGTIRLKTRKISAHALVERAIKNFDKAITQKNLKVENKVASDMTSLKADPDRLMEVLENLIGNAVKYSEKGGFVEITAEEKVGGNIVLKFKDKGRGIKAEDFQNIFRKFWRGDPSDVTAHTGLGLFITRQLLKMMGGEIWFESEYGKGSTFYIRLPVASEK